MARTIGIGYQDFEELIRDNAFYIDKTDFIREWWEGLDRVTLLTRPRRFGKTLLISMTEQFFSVQYAGQGKLFEGLSIWKKEKYRRLQGTYPVISLSFANIKDTNYKDARKKICLILENLYIQNRFLLESGVLTEKEEAFFQHISADMGDVEAAMALHRLSEFLCRYYGKKVIILLDEYDTPMQEAYVDGYWTELTSFIRNLFHASFKTNPYLERAIMTGITRVGRESVFSDLNNLAVITTTADCYTDSFGFTQEEVDRALGEYGLTDERESVKQWYDGFIFGNRRGIYNPWSILNYLKNKRFGAYWANTSSNSLIEKLIREGSADVKMAMEDLLKGNTLSIQLDEQIVFDQLDGRNDALWSFLLAGGYLRAEAFHMDKERGRMQYELAITNKEVRIMFEEMIQGWFARLTPAYNEFVRALLGGDIKAMNTYINKVALASFSYFDTGKRPSYETEPERFYHGFVLGLLVELADRYAVSSNRESGFGRYDVLLEPRDSRDGAYILEFKVYNPEEERTLEDTVRAAKKQIEERKYASVLEERGVLTEKIRSYGFAFEGKKVLIG